MNEYIILLWIGLCVLGAWLVGKELEISFSTGQFVQTETWDSGDSETPFGDSTTGFNFTLLESGELVDGNHSWWAMYGDEILFASNGKFVYITPDSISGDLENAFSIIKNVFDSTIINRCFMDCDEETRLRMQDYQLRREGIRVMPWNHKPKQSAKL